jgi:hypothetical protein
MQPGGSSHGQLNVDNNNTPDNHFEPFIYYEHSLTKLRSTNDWPKEWDVQNAAQQAMIDMTRKNYQGATYEFVVRRADYMDGSCWLQKAGELKFCTWKWGGQCSTRGSPWALDYYTQGRNGCVFGEHIA